jgi:uncharacterized membrane protein (UPF0127 family)
VNNYLRLVITLFHPRSEQIILPILEKEHYSSLGRLHGFITVLEFKTLIVFLSVALLAFSGFKLLSCDALGQGKILDSDEANTKSLPNKVNVTINNVNLLADVALTTDEQTKGLSIKDTLQFNEGMLFPYEAPRILSFWMKDMKFPIDILWLDADKKVVHIEERLQPCSPLLLCPSYTSDVQAQYVLETVAGFSSANGITEGAPVEFNLPR